MSENSKKRERDRTETRIKMRKREGIEHEGVVFLVAVETVTAAVVCGGISGLNDLRFLIYSTGFEVIYSTMS